jgi:hypothetical protein
MKLNRIELKKIMYEFNAKSSRLLKANFNDYGDILKKYIHFLDETEIIRDYIADCGVCDQDMEQEFKEVKTQHAIFEIGDTTEEEVRNVYAILKYSVENIINIPTGIAMSYSSSRKYQEILKDFNDRVTMVLILNIETHLTKIGIEMGIGENVSNSITVNNSQLNIANENAVINATNTVNGLSIDELEKLISEIELAAEGSNLSSDDAEMLSCNLEVIQEEVKADKPRVGFLKTAISGLKAIKGTAEFGAAVIALVQFIQPLIG